MTDQPTYNDGDVVNGYRYDAAHNEWIQIAAPPAHQDGDVVNGHQYSAALNQWIPLPAAAAPPVPAPTSPPSSTVEAWAPPVAPPQSGSPAEFVAPTQALTPVSSAVATGGPGSQGALETSSPQNVIKRRNVLGTVALTYRREMRGWRDEAQSTFEASRSGSIGVRRLPVPA
jgi:hypothetical protein